MLFDSPVRWSPGTEVAIICPSGMALVDGTLALDSAEHTWVALTQEPRLSVFLQEFAASTNTSLLDMPGFAVVIFTDGECHVAVRGNFEVEVVTATGSELLTGKGITTWTEKLVTDARYVKLSSREVGEESAPIVSGVVTAGALQWGDRASVEVSVPATDAHHDDEGLPDEAEEQAADGVQPALDDALPEVEGVQLAAEQLAAKLIAEVELDEPGLADFGAVEPEQTEFEADLEVAEFSLDLTPVDEKPLLDEGLQLGETVVSADAYPTAGKQLGWLVVEGGESVPVKGPIVVGRTPLVTAIETDEPAVTLVLPYPHVSNNHIAFLVEDDQVLALDLNSSNGSFLIRSGNPMVRLPNHPVSLEPGDVIDLGRGVLIRLDGV